MNSFTHFSLKPLSIIIAAAPLTALAQDPMLDEIVVTATMADSQPLNKSEVKAEHLAPLLPATSDAATLLRNIPGMSLYGAGGLSSLPAIHGLADDRVRVQVDGMGLISSCPNHMNSPLSYIDPTNVSSIRVFAGITPVSAGGDSIGGTIQMNSAPPEFAAPGEKTLLKGEAGTFYRSNGNATGANIGATMASEKLSVSYKGSTAKSDDYKAADDFKTSAMVASSGLAADVVGSSNYKSVNQDFGVALRHNYHLLELKIGTQNIPYEGFPNQRMDMTKNDSTQVNLHYTGQQQWGTLESRIYTQTAQHSMNFGDDKQFWYGTPATIPGMPMDTEGKTKGVVINGNIVLSEGDIFRIGGEYQNYRLNDWWSPSGGMMMSPETFWNINNGQRDRFDLFAEWEARWNPQWGSQLGVRSDTVRMDTGTVQGYNTGMMYAPDATAFNALDHQRTDHNWDLTALASYTSTVTRSFEAGYARKSRSPNLYQRYTWSKLAMAAVMNNSVGDGNGYVGNIDLKPEVAHTLSATGDWHDAARVQWGVKVTPYYTYVQDYIDAQRLPGQSTAATGFVNLQYVNQSAHLYGIDIDGNRSLGSSNDYGSFTATGLLNYTRGINQTTNDNLYNVMPLHAKLAVEQQLGSWNNSAEVQLVTAKTAVSQVRNEIRTAGYGLLNLRSSYQWKQVRLDVGVENLLNKNYALPLGGAYVGEGMTMSQNGIPWGIAVPGMGRSIYAGLNVKF